jgi:uncharacterized protein YqhQ
LAAKYYPAGDIILYRLVWNSTRVLHVGIQGTAAWTRLNKGGVTVTEHDTFWEKEFLELSQIPDEEIEEPEDEERPLSAKIFSRVIGVFLAGFAFFLPPSYLATQGLLVWPLNLIFIAMGAIVSLFIFFACYNWPIEEIY